MTGPESPRLPRLVVLALVPEPVSEFLLGDLEEDFLREAQAHGRAAARRRYWKRSLLAAWHGRRLRLSVTRRTPRRSLHMWNLWRDLALGVRTALRSPGYSAVAIITIALAIGANTLLFSIANPLLVRALPIKDPDTLGWVAMLNPARGVTARGRTSMADFLDWRATAHSFSVMAAYDTREATLTGIGDAEAIITGRATTTLVDIWGLTPVAGRVFQPGEDAPGRDGVAVLSHRYWRERFNASPDALNRRILLDGRSATIVGVMKPEIEIGNLALIDAWTTLPLDAAAPRDTRTLALAAAGLYGVISYSVGQRRREFGVRLALGAAPASIRRMVLGEGLRVVGIGAAIGLVLAAGLAYVARSLLFGISAADPLTFAGVTGIVLLVGLVAMWAPAARAMRVDPARTLKAD